MARTVRFHEVGGPEVLKIEEEAPKQPDKGEVRLEVQAVGLNRVESMFMEEIYLRPLGRWTVPSEDRENISLRADRGGLQISRIERAGGEGCDHCYADA